MGPIGFQVAVREHYQLDDRLMNAVEGLLDTQVDALLIAGEPGHTFDIPDIPTVVEGTRLHDVADADHVGSDEPLGVQLIMRHLHERGHRRIGHVTGIGGSAQARLDAYRQNMRDWGETPRYAGESNDTNEEGGYVGTLQLLEEHPDVTAVFAANDTMALGARAALREHGLEVPADIALAGYDDSLLARSRFLDLTTIDTRGFEVGHACGEMLLRRLEDPGRPRQSIHIPPRLVIRSSSSSPAHITPSPDEGPPATK